MFDQVGDAEDQQIGARNDRFQPLAIIGSS